MKVGHYFEGRNFFYLMHLSYGTLTEEDRRMRWNYAKNHSLIGLDLPEEVPKDWNQMSNSEKQRLRSRRPNWFHQFEIFCNEMRINDLVVVVNGWDSLLGIGKVNQSRYEYRKELRDIFFDHVRSVEWDRAQDYDERIQLSPTLSGFNRTLLRVKANTKFWTILSNVNL
ncbi:MAG: hypothetical protein QXL57_04345 [Candidatus Bathyarchaeia archaeon]